MKQGLKLLLPVTFDGVAVADISKIEFVFTQEKYPSSPILKTSLFGGSGGDVTENDGVFYVPWTVDETYAFRADAPFYMDTRITLTESPYQPPTNIVKLTMNSTLFKQED